MTTFQRTVIVFVFLPLHLLFVSGSIFAQGKITEQEIASFVETFRTQSAAWQTGDVLFSFEQFFDSTEDDFPGKFEESLGYHRFRFDHANKNYWYYGSSVTKSGVTVPGKPLNEKRYAASQAFVIRNGKARIRKGPNRSSTAEFTDWPRWVDAQKFPQLAFRNVGFVPFDSHTLADGDVIAESWISGFDKRSASRLEDGSVRISFVHQNPKDPGMHHQAEWTWDHNLLAPTRHVLYRYFLNRRNPLKLKIWEENYGWDEKGGVLVPIHINRETPVSMRRGDSIVEYASNKVAKFHWFSINQPIPEEKFSLSIDDIVKIEAEIDPKQTGASSL